MFSNSVIAAIRTGVAALVGILLTWLISQGIEIPDDFSDKLTVIVTTLVIAFYNLGVNFLERNVSPNFGFLLGVPKAPVYPTGPVAKPAGGNDGIDPYAHPGL